MDGEANNSKRVYHIRSRAFSHLFTKLRDKETNHSDYVAYSNRIMRVLAEEGIAALPTKSKKILTPTGAPFDGVEVDEGNICAVSIIRAGDSLLEAVRACIPSCYVGKILIQRDESTPEKLPRLIYTNLPPDVADRDILLCDPMLATGGSVKKAISVLLDAGVLARRIIFINVISCPEGIEALHSAYPEVTIVTGAIDPSLNHDKFIVPGLGDYGDRYFGTTGTPA